MAVSLPNDLDLVFPNDAGNHTNNKNMLRRHFRPALLAAGCPAIRFHDLRHTYASLLIALGREYQILNLAIPYRVNVFQEADTILDYTLTYKNLRETGYYFVPDGRYQ